MGLPKGVSGNLRGRPKAGKALTDLLRTYLNTKDPDELFARKKLLVAELYKRAMGHWSENPETGAREFHRGSDDLLRYCFDRLDGRPDVTQKIDLIAELPAVVMQFPEDHGEQ